MNFSFGFVDISATFANDDMRKNKIISIFAYIPFLFFIPVLLARRSPVAKFHANQGVVLTVVAVISWLFFEIFWIFAPAAPLFSLITVLLDIYGIYCVLKEKAVEFPLISGFRLFK